MSGQAGGIGVVVEQLPHPVVDVVGKGVIQVVGLYGAAQVHLPVGGVEQFLQPLPGAGGDGDHWDAQLLGQPLHIDLVPPFGHLVHKVQGQHRGPLQLQQLDGKVQVALQVGGIHDVDDAVRGLPDDEIPGDDLLHGVGRQGVDARQVHDGQGLVAQTGGALLLLHRHSGPVAHILVRAGQGVEEGGLAAVGVARQSHPHGPGVVGSGVIAPPVLLELVLVVPQLAAGGLRVGHVPGHGTPGGPAPLHPPGLSHPDLGRVRPAQGHLIPPQAHFQGVAQRGDLGHLHHSPGSQPHVHQAALHRPGLVAHRQDHPALPGGQVIQGPLPRSTVF